ncbi:prepilin-type N-terminal cleavage/methylation domain-containing protein [Patescibacteria group bacterium]|nr:prepilin-type N-terminal cleavage/methylation domain-containing protein [Patescibacteria group bacterium]
MKSFLKNSQKGATLIELLLYFSLLGILLTVVTDLMLRTSEFSLEAAAKNDLQEDARFIISKFGYDIRRADSVSLPANLGDISSTLEFTLGTEDHSYNLAGTDLEYAIETRPPPRTQTANFNSNLTKVTSLTFQRLGNVNGNHLIKINFELEVVKRQKGVPNTKTFETVVGIR